MMYRPDQIAALVARKMPSWRVFVTTDCEGWNIHLRSRSLGSDRWDIKVEAAENTLSAASFVRVMKALRSLPSVDPVRAETG